MDVWCLLRFYLGFSCSVAMNHGEGPLNVTFNPCDTLKVELQLLNYPKEHNYYKITKRDSSSEIEGYLKDGVTVFKMPLMKSDDLEVLEISLQSPGGKLGLTRELFKFKLAKSVMAPRLCKEITRKITVHWGSTTSSDTDRSRVGVSDKIWVTPPQTLQEVCAAFAVFTCHSTGDPRDLLSWYQQKGNDNSQLIMKQFPRATSKANMSLILNKTITSYDEGSTIYCMLRKAREANTFFSRSINISFCSTIQLSEAPYITVQPASTVATFTTNTTRSFECGGSRPADGRSFNWYIQDVSDSNNFSHAPAENMVSNSNTNKVTLTLYLNESYHSKRIYCVQEYYMNLESTEDIFYYWNYGENFRSHEIQLLMVPELPEDHHTVADNLKNGTGEVSPALLVSIFLGVMAVLAALSALVILRRRCRRQENSNESINRSQENDNEGIYASAQVTYAELQFSSESGNILRREEATPYAEIIGSCRPKADRN